MTIRVLRSPEDCCFTCSANRQLNTEEALWHGAALEAPHFYASMSVCSPTPCSAPWSKVSPARLREQSLPYQPSWHLQKPRRHRPWAEHWLGHICSIGMSQYLPVWPSTWQWHLQWRSTRQGGARNRGWPAEMRAGDVVGNALISVKCQSHLHVQHLCGVCQSHRSQLRGVLDQQSVCSTDASCAYLVQAIGTKQSWSA